MSPRVRLLHSVFALLFLAFCAAGAPARSPALRWEKIKIYHALPSQVFSRLGLTHSTKNGYTRDGKAGVPDPTFPPGLTDVVPSDTDHLLLIRGTADGRELFRRRVASVDFAAPVATTVQGTVELIQGSDANGTILASVTPIITLDFASPITLSDPAGTHQYKLNIHRNPNGWYLLSLQRGIPLAASPVAVKTYVPSLAWTEPVTKLVKPGDPALFADSAADRHPAGVAALSPAETGLDYTVRVTLTEEPSAHH